MLSDKEHDHREMVYYIRYMYLQLINNRDKGNRIIEKWCVYVIIMYAVKSDSPCTEGPPCLP